MNTIQMLAAIEKLNASLYGKDFLLTWDKSVPEGGSVWVFAIDD